MRDVARFLPLRKAFSSLWRAFYLLIGVSAMFFVINFYLIGERKSESAQKLTTPTLHRLKKEGPTSTNLDLVEIFADIELPVHVELPFVGVGKRNVTPTIATFFKTVKAMKTRSTSTTTSTSTSTTSTASTTTTKKEEVIMVTPPRANVRDLEHLQEKLKKAAQVVTPANEKKPPDEEGDSLAPTSILKRKERVVESSEQPHYIQDGQCPTMSCPDGQHAIYLQSGYRLKTCPMICWKSANLAEYNYSDNCPESARGLHIVVIEPAPVVKVKTKKMFDTYTRDEDLLDFLLSTEIATGDVVLAVTFDESSTMLQENTRNILSYFGSQYIQNIRFRDTFAMVGQKGIEKGAAFEAMRHKRIEEDFGYPVSLSICAKFPLAQVAQLPPGDALRQLGSNVHIGVMSHCNMDTSCPTPGTVPVFLSSGNGNKGDPQLCVNSLLVFHPIMKIGKRGYNMAEYNPISQEIITRDAFDGYTEEPSRLVIFLDQIADGNLLLGVIHDDASVRQLAYYFDKFGISIIHDIKYRSVAWFIGQRGAKHAYQQISHSPNEKDFATPVSYRACIPTQIVGLRRIGEPQTGQISLELNDSTNNTEPSITTTTDVILSKATLDDAEERRVQFCSRFTGFNDLCFQTEQIWQMMPDVLDPLITKQWRAIEETDVDRVPIIVMAGGDFTTLHSTLEQLSNQPGLRRDLVTVFASEIIFNDELRALVTEAFQLKLERLEAATYEELYKMALENASLIAEQKKIDAFIFIEPDVLLSPDFFVYLSNMYSLLNEDAAFGGISAWNHNGYEFFSNDPNANYLSDSALPSPCFLMRNSYYAEFIKPSFEKCCHDEKSRFSPWKIEATASPFLVPEISRCFKPPPNLAVAKGVKSEGVLIDALFHQPRRTSMKVPPPLTIKERQAMFGYLKVSSYGDHLNRVINQSIVVDIKPNDKGDQCGFVKSSDLHNGVITDRVKYVALFKQTAKNDWTDLHEIAKCFGLKALEFSTKLDGVIPIGIYKQTFRFTTPTAEYILVSKISPFFTYNLVNRI